MALGQGRHSVGSVFYDKCCLVLSFLFIRGQLLLGKEGKYEVQSRTCHYRGKHCRPC